MKQTQKDMCTKLVQLQVHLHEWYRRDLMSEKLGLAQTLCFQFPLRLLVIFGSVHTVLSRKVSTSDNEVTWKSTVVRVG